MVLAQRREAIRNILLEKKTISVAQLSEFLNVSSETIRRDLDILSQEGFCKKTYGGATLNTRNTAFVPQAGRRSLLLEEKRQMAQIALQFIQPNDCIFIDYTSTVSSICSVIKDIPLTIVTNSVSVFQDLAGKKNIQLILTGGKFSEFELGLFSADAETFVRNHHVDKLFFSPHALDLERGIFDGTDYTASLHKLFLEHSSEHYLLADHTKLGRRGFANILPDYRKIDYLITDEPLSEEWQNMLNEQGVPFIWSQKDKS